MGSNTPCDITVLSGLYKILFISLHNRHDYIYGFKDDKTKKGRQTK